MGAIKNNAIESKRPTVFDAIREAKAYAIETRLQADAAAATMAGIVERLAVLETLPSWPAVMAEYEAYLAQCWDECRLPDPRD